MLADPRIGRFRVTGNDQLPSPPPPPETSEPAIRYKNIREETEAQNQEKSDLSLPTRNTQFRDYTIKEGEMEEWLTEWRAHLHPLRTQQGFHILAAWTIAELNRFQWIIRWEGKGSFEEADKAYYASQERKHVQPNPARHLEKAEHFYIEPVLEEEAWTKKKRK